MRFTQHLFHITCTLELSLLEMTYCFLYQGLMATWLTLERGCTGVSRPCQTAEWNVSQTASTELLPQLVAQTLLIRQKRLHTATRQHCAITYCAENNKERDA